MNVKDYYKILGINRNASQQEIKKAYKTMSLRYHPDKNSFPDARQKYDDIREAYDILSDMNKKTKYDKEYDFENIATFRSNVSWGIPNKFNIHFQQDISSSPSGFDNFNTNNYASYNDVNRSQDTSFNTDNINTNPNYSRNPNQFNNKNNFNQQTKQDNNNNSNNNQSDYNVNTQSGDDTINFGSNNSTNNDINLEIPTAVKYNIQVPLNILYTGIKRTITISRRVKGQNDSTPKEEKEKLDINIKAGWKEGTKIIFKGKGDRIYGKPIQDIIFIINEEKHKYFTREDNDIVFKLDLKFKDALVGFKFGIDNVDGEYLHFKTKELSYPNKKYIIPKKGMPKKGDYNNRGDFIIICNVIFPEKINEEQRETIKKIF